MKKTRKLISILLVMAMLITCVPAISFADTQVAEASTSKYIINDNFAENDINGWTVYDTTKMSAADIVDADDSSNYLMHISNSQTAVASGESDNVYVYKAMPDGGIPYTKNADVIIEARVKLLSDSGRLFVKFDLDGTNDGINSNKNTFILIKPNEINWRIKKSTWGDTGVVPNEETLVGEWLTLKIRIKGTTKNADYEVSTAENTYSATSIDATVFNNTVNDKIEMGDALSNIAFRTWGKDEACVDYVRVYKEYTASVSVSEIMTPDGTFNAVLNADNAPDNLASYFTLTDSEGVADENAEITQNGNVVAVKTSKSFTTGDVFKLTVDKAGLADLGYIFEDNTEEYFVTASNYYINDSFGNGDINGWIANGDLMSAEAIADPENPENYVMHITNSQTPTSSGESDNINVLKAMPGNGIVYDENSNVVIETRIKLVSDDARMFLKFDLDGTNDWLIHNKQTFFMVKPNELNWRVKKSTWGDTGVVPSEETLVGEWVDAKVTIKGTSKTADYEIKTAENTYSATSIDATVFNNTVNDKIEMGDALTNLAFKTWGSDEIYVDYIKVYKEYSATISVPDIMTPDGVFNVTFNADKVPGNLASFFTLKDSDGVVDENAEMTQDGGILTVKASKSVSEGEIYTLVADEEAFINAGYTVTNIEPEYEITVSKYIINDNFANGDINGWTANGSAMSATAIADPDNSENYVMHITNSQAPTSSGESDNINVLKAMPGDGIAYDENSNVVIETRIKLASDDARMFLKFDLDGTNDWLIHNKQTFFMVKPNELNWRVKKSTWGDTGVVPSEETLVGEWVDAKVTIKGTSKTADYEIKTAENTYSATSIDATVFNNTVNDKVEMGDALTNLAFKTWGSDEIYVDYVKVYKVYDASISIPETANSEGEFDIIFDASEIPSNLASYFTLKDSEGNICNNATMTVTEKGLSVKVADAVIGEKYILCVDKNGIANAGYNISGVEAEYEITVSKYILNDNFANGDINGWTANGSAMSATAIADPDNSGNYVMHITNSQAPTSSGESDNINVLKEMPGNGIVYDENSDVVIETRIKLVSDDARMFLKFDLDGTNDWLIHNKQTFFMVKPNELNWRVKKSTWGDTGVVPNEETLVGEWVDAKVTIKGTSKTADYEIKTAENTYSATSIDATVFNNTVNDKIEMGDVLTNLAFKTWGSDEIYVDYIRVYKTTDASVIVPEVTNCYGEFDVIFDSAEIPSNLASFFALKDSDGNICENATMTVTEKGLSVKVADAVVDEIYTLTVDKAGIEACGYVLADTEEEYEITVSKYILNDNFASDDINGWIVNGSAMSAAAIADPDNSGNYVMQIKNTQIPTNSGESDNINVLKEMPKGPITYTDEENIVIETRIKLVSDDARMFLKFDLDGTNDWLIHNKQTFFMVKPNELNWRVKKSTWSDTGVIPNEETLVGEWVDATVIIKGTSKTADYMIKTAENTYMATNIDARVFNNVTDEKIEMGDALTNLAFKTWGSDEVYVDYIRVYKESSSNLVEMKLSKDGVEVTDGVITEGSSYVPSLNYVPASFIDEEYVFITALFKNGVIEDIKSYMKGETPTAITVPETEDEYEIKLFLWKKGTMEPLGDSIEYREDNGDTYFFM